MSRNVEVKARLHDREAAMDLILELKAKIEGNDENDEPDVMSVTVKQTDTFFNLPAGGGNGKLKVRKALGFVPEIIYYERAETAGPRLSSYKKCNISNDLDEILTKSLGVLGVVKKSRTLVMIDRTRVHFDTVEGLGDFVEIEVVLKADESIEEGKKIALELMKCMKIEEKDLLPVAYLNLLNLIN